ncbi:hypothetical protein GEMRC1_009292 [Eukaryota sp. GEM-RC1]
MFLHSTIKSPSSIYSVVNGFFSSGQSQDIVVSKGSTLDLYTLSDNKLTQSSTFNTYSLVRAMCSVKRYSQELHYIAVTSDSGFLTLLSMANGVFQPVATSSLGRPGFRRSIPGEFLCSDTEGRVIFCSSIDGTKSAHLLTLKDDLSFATSVWLPQSTTYSVVLGAVCLDTGPHNPIFVTLEASLENETPVKTLHYYSFLMGNNAFSHLEVS